MKQFWIYAYRNYRRNKKLTTRPVERAASATSILGANWNQVSHILDALKIAADRPMPITANPLVGGMLVAL